MARTLIGLDCEMTGTDWTAHKLIQIGLCLDPRDETKNFVADVGWPKGTYKYNQESLNVIKWDFDRIEAGDYDYEVENDILNWCAANDLKEKSLVPVGYAVKTFDMPFVLNTFPRFAEYFIFPNVNGPYRPYLCRACDLTDVTYGMTYGRTGTAKSNKGRPEDWGFDGWKRAGKQYAVAELTKLGDTRTFHDAGYDAKAAMLALEFYNANLR